MEGLDWGQCPELAFIKADKSWQNLYASDSVRAIAFVKFAQKTQAPEGTERGSLWQVSGIPDGAVFWAEALGPLTTGLAKVMADVALKLNGLNAGGQFNGLIAALGKLQAPPSFKIHSISPAVVPLSGGKVTIRGAGFEPQVGSTGTLKPKAQVLLDGTLGISVTLVNDAELSFVAPPEQPGNRGVQKQVQVKIEGSLSNGATLTYAPFIERYVPLAASAGSTMTIKGYGLKNAQKVSFERAAREIAPGTKLKIISDEELSIEIPALPDGVLPPNDGKVWVDIPDGRSNSVPFTYT